MTQNLANNAQSSLSAGITSSATTLSVASATTFPSAPFVITIDSEILNVSAVSGTTFTVQRGQEGTTAAAHSSGATVQAPVTAQALQNLARPAYIGNTVPSGGQAGDIRIGSGMIWVNDGGSWKAVALTLPIIDVTGEVYGSGIGLDSRNNYQIGGPANRGASFRFRCTQSSVPVKVALNQRWGSGGYSAGTGGVMKCAIQADDGTGDPNGTDLMSLTWTPGDFPGGQEDRTYLTFPSGVALSAGTLYHLVFTNIDASPTTNYMSLNLVYQNNVAAYPAQRQPAWPNTDLSALFKVGGVWKQPGDSGISDPNPQQDTPVFDLQYANGGHDGQGYFGTINTSAAQIGGTSLMARARFTVIGPSKTVSRAGFRVMRTAGTGGLLIQLMTAGGAVLQSGTVASSTFPLVGAPPTNLFGGQWGEITFADTVLTTGQTYILRVSAAAGTTYYTLPLQAHDIPGSGNPDWQSRLLYGVSGAAAFGGSAEKTTDGSTWGNFYDFEAVDAQFYVGN